MGYSLKIHAFVRDFKPALNIHACEYLQSVASLQLQLFSGVYVRRLPAVFSGTTAGFYKVQYKEAYIFKEQGN